MAGKLYTSYTGFPSFFSGKIASVEDVEEGTLVVAGVPIDQGVVTGRPGARYGPRGIREASMQHRGAYEVSAENTLMDVETGIWRKPVASPPLIDIGDFDINPTDMRDTTEIVIKGVADVVRRGGIPVLLGGDHYVAYPGFAGFSKGMTERGGAPRLGYLHIDSHPDFRDVHGVGGKYTHGTQARRLSEDTHISYNNMAWVGLNGSVIDPAQPPHFPVGRHAGHHGQDDPGAGAGGNCEECDGSGGAQRGRCLRDDRYRRSRRVGVSRDGGPDIHGNHRRGVPGNDGSPFQLRHNQGNRHL